MMEQIGNALRLQKILQQLAVGDDVIRNNACDEALSFIDSLPDNQKDIVWPQIVPHLIMLGRWADADKMIDNMMTSKDESCVVNAYIARIEYWRKQPAPDDKKIMEAIDCYLSFAKQTGNEHTIISAYLIHGLHRVHHQLYSDAIKDFSEVACLADYLHSRHYAALSKYHTGYCLYKLGKLSLANEYLHRATELAWYEKNPQIAKQSETMRAIVLMDQGKKDETVRVMKQWEKQFATQL